MTKPVQATTGWAAPIEDMSQTRDVPPANQLTKPGRHPVAEFVEKNKHVQAERRARYLRDYQGNIPPPEHQISTRTPKSSSRVRFPTAAFRRGYAHIDWTA